MNETAVKPATYGLFARFDLSFFPLLSWGQHRVPDASKRREIPGLSCSHCPVKRGIDAVRILLERFKPNTIFQRLNRKEFNKWHRPSSNN